MGISRLVYGRSAIQGLYLLPEQWYDDHAVHAWLNTMARRTDLRAQRVLLGTGEALPYGRLILAMGSSASVPKLDGLKLPGSFVLRQAGDAMGIRAYAQQHGCRRAGGDMVLTAETPATILKSVGLELFSIGRVEASPTDDVIVVDRPGVPSYRRLLISKSRAVGATVLGHHPADVTAAQKAIRKRAPVSPGAYQALRSGDWSVLAESPALVR